ncbi:MAG: M1 family aminopeptidase [Chloroflexota bacterium]
MSQRIFILPLILLFIAVTACDLSSSAPPIPTPTENPGGPTFAPIVTVTPIGLVTTSTATACAEQPLLAAVRYDLDTDVNMDTHSLITILKATYRNETDQPLPQIVFNIEPNRKPDVFMLTHVDSTAAIQRYTLNGPRLEINLKTPLPVGCEATFTLAFTLHPSQITQSYIGNTGYFGYTERQFNLGEWLPEFAPLIKGVWQTPKVWAIGEYTVSALSDFTATVKVIGKDAAKFDVVGPGEVEHPHADTWHFKMSSARTFTLSISAALTRLDAHSDVGVNIEFYYFTLDKSAGTPVVPVGAKHALETARTALNTFTPIYGPLPYKRLVIIEGDFPDGMEFSGMVFVSQHWFSLYTGSPDAWLTLITAHEILHQWWYSLVGSDQGAAPFLDEGLALYSEVVYMQAQYPTLVPWWWNFRVKSYVPQGYVDSGVYDFQNLRLYINAVYLRGALMLQEIRESIGDEAFFQWLRTYRTGQAGKIATVVDLWQAMSPGDYTKTAAIRAKYLRLPDPLHLASATAAPTAASTEACCG